MVKSRILIKLILLSILFAQTVLSCNEKKDKNLDEKRLYKVTGDNIATSFSTKPADILKDFKTWYTYTYYNIKLAQDFIGLDKDSNVIKKDAFLKLIITGDYFPVKIYEKNNLPFYKLYLLITDDVDILTTAKQIAQSEFVNYNMEGEELPSYKLEDLNGNIYTKANTKGKIVVLKCWFIHCVACVKEFPELNKLVDEYKNRKDILFISLAMDSKQALSAFLKTKEFKYKVVPNQEGYMINELKISSFPTHILIGKNGKISNVVSRSTDLIPALKKEVVKL